MSDHDELIISGAVATASVQDTHTQRPADACELVIGGAIATASVQDILQSSGSAPSGDDENEQVGAGDVLQALAAYQVTLSDTITATDSALALRSDEQQTGDTAGASDTLNVLAHYVVVIDETLSASDEVKPRLRAGLSFYVSAFAQDKLKTDADAAVIWTARTDSLAMSVLVPEDADSLNALEVAHGELSASGASGLYRFTAPAAAPYLQTGWLHPEGGGLWRAAYCYLEHSGEPLILHLTVSDGAAQTYSYSTAPRTADETVVSRIQLGRGIRAKAFRLGLSAAHFVLDGGELALTETSRKF